ncbi:hypothetical protein AAG906_037845 [Vitis piasezkii]
MAFKLLTTFISPFHNPPPQSRCARSQSFHGLHSSLHLYVGKPSNELYIATMRNETALDFKSKLEKIETSRKDNDKEALKDNPPDATEFMFSHINYHRISLNEEESGWIGFVRRWQ